MMKRKMIILVMLLSILALPLNASVVIDDNIELRDKTGDAFGYLDIEQVSFYEKESDSDVLFVNMKITDPSKVKFQQTFAAFWTYEGKQYACGLGIGFGLGKNWMIFDAGQYDNGAPYGGPGIQEVEGTYDISAGTITWSIPKDVIGDPQKGEVLTQTWANAFRRLGLLGRIGLPRPLLNTLVLILFQNKLYDGVPDGAPQEFGDNYTIQY